jgi:hypothetical protein
MSVEAIVNLQHSDVALIWLLTLKSHASASDPTVFRAAANLEDIIRTDPPPSTGLPGTTGGAPAARTGPHTYTAFPFDIILAPDDGQKPQSVSLTFPDIGQELMDIIRRDGSNFRPSVKLQLVASNNLNSSEKTIDFLEVSNVTYNALTITFELSSSSIFARKTCTGTYNQREFPGLFFQLK